MATNTIKRGRPPRGPDRAKADSLDIRCGAAEKAAFKDAAALAGLDLSAWMRARLRSAARKELDAAGMPVSFLLKSKAASQNGKAEKAKKGAPRRVHEQGASLAGVTEARYVKPHRMFLRFADGREGTWTFDTLKLDMSHMRLRTIRASASGDAVEVTSKWGDRVKLDSSSLRYLVDRGYAAELDKKLDSLAKKIGL